MLNTRLPAFASQSRAPRALRPVWALSLGSLLVLAACGGSDESGTGTMRLALTDTPACGYDNIYVTVLGARVHKNVDALDGDSGWVNFTLPGTPKRIDLLALNNGTLEELGQTPLPSGKYNQLRLLLAANGSQAPFANAVVVSATAKIGRAHV